MGGKLRTLRFVVLAILLPVVLVLGISAGVVYAFGGLRDNPAQDALSPFTARLKAIGGTSLCEKGDAGYGTGDGQPFYQAEILLPNAATARAALFDAATRQGIHLELNKKDSGDGGETVYQTADHLPNRLPTLMVIIETEGDTSGACGDQESVGKPIPKGGALYALLYTSPSR